MKRYLLWLSICSLSGASALAQTQRALLIGIDLYQPPGTTAQHEAGCTYGRCELSAFENLEGAVNDAQSMADVLTNPKFGFPADKVVLLTNPGPRQARPGVVVLPASETTHDGILAAMQKYLVDLPQAGDTVVFYDASHGSLRVNTVGDKLTVRGDDGSLLHVDSTLVPSDAYKGGYDVRDREMTRIFNAALDKGVHLTVIFDSCHSGGATRGLGGLRQRALAYDPRPVNDPPDVLPNGQKVLAPSERPGNPALVFAAVQQDQVANEAPASETSPEAHGAFTAALLETLQVLPADAPAALVYQRVKAVLEGHGTVGQEPDLDANPERRQQPLFGGSAGTATAKVRTAALKTDEGGSVWLDIGEVSGVGPGSEFTALVPDAQGKKTTLRVDKALGIARYTASVVSPEGATVNPGDVFELSKLVLERLDPLRFWVGSASLPAANIAAAVAQIKATGLTTISDPAEEPYTDVLAWDGTTWTLTHAANTRGDEVSLIKKPATPRKLGAPLTAESLKKAASPNAKVWVDLPASTELAAKLGLDDSGGGTQSSNDLASANYLLAGSIVKGTPSYAWLHKDEYAKGPRNAVTRDHSPGCSATSPYPVRSDWVSTTDTSAPEAGAQTLNTYAVRLGKVHGWLELADNAVTGSSETGYYKLELVHMSDTVSVDMDQPAHENDRMRLALAASGQIRESRWVYILDIDCHGTGTLIYPNNYSENQYPGDGDHDKQIILRHAPTLKVGPPYGIDTMILLSTAQPLPDPSVLNFEGVARGATRGAKTPLEQLLSNTSSGSRGITADVEVPTNWGLEVLTLRSVPRDVTGK